MQTVKVETKIAILLSPHELDLHYALLELLYIQKSGKGINYTLFYLHNKELNKYYSHLPQQVKDALYNFSPNAYAAFHQRLMKLFLSKKLSEADELQIRTSTLRHFHSLFERLKPFAHLLKWYHKTKLEKGKNYKTSPAAFSPFKPLFNFHVAAEKGRLVLKTQVIINGASYNLAEFNRYNFLLESNNEYFLLSYKDYQTLEWIKENNRDEYSKRDSKSFVKFFQDPCRQRGIPRHLPQPAV